MRLRSPIHKCKLMSGDFQMKKCCAKAKTYICKHCMGRLLKHIYSNTTTCCNVSSLDVADDVVTFSLGLHK